MVECKLNYYFLLNKFTNHIYFEFRYRLGVIDHGQFSFIDVNHHEWPIGLVTNPKNAQFSMPRKENLQSIIDSTHIR